MRSREHSASFYLFLAKKQVESGDFSAAYESLEQVKGEKFFASEIEQLFSAVNNVILDEYTQFAFALICQAFAVKILEEGSCLPGYETEKVLSLLKHLLEMLLLAAHADEISGQEWVSRQQNILISMTADLIANTPLNNQAANLNLILDLNRMSARLAELEDDVEWYRGTYLDLAEVAETHGLLELRDRLCAASSVYADFIKEQAYPLLFARQQDPKLAARGSRKLQKFAKSLRARRSLSR